MARTRNKMRQYLAEGYMAFVVSVPDFLSQLESECEKERYQAEIGSLVTFVKVGVGNWSCDLDTCSLATHTGAYSHSFCLF